MKISLRVEGMDRVRAELAKLSREQLAAATADALNDAAFDIRRRYQAELRTVFDRPTPYIVNSPEVVKASVVKPEAIVRLRPGGGKAVEAAQILAAQVRGGGRADKRSEAALRRIGILPPGYMTAIPNEPFPGSHDGRGNIRGPFMVRLLSYLKAFGEQGYRANMTDRRRKSIARRGVSERGYKTINGYELFVSYGRLKGGSRGRRTAHLAPGVWARRGIHGVEVKPVLMFVRSPTYSRRLSMDKIGNVAKTQAVFERRMRYRVRLAAGV